MRRGGESITCEGIITEINRSHGRYYRMKEGGGITGEGGGRRVREGVESQRPMGGVIARTRKGAQHLFGGGE